MLARATYSTEELTAARARIDAGLAAGAPTDLVVLALDNIFANRQRGKEAKDGALKELRAAAESLAADPSATGPDDVSDLTQRVFAELEARFT